MVGPLLLLKIMHCKKKCSETFSRKNKERPDTSSKKGPTLKKESNTPQTICRVCLKEGNIPIFAKNKSEDIPQALVTFGGIEISNDDEHPKHLCSPCHALLQGAILFRKSAQESDRILKTPEKVQQDDTIIDDLFDGMELEDDAFDFHIPVEKGNDYHCHRCDIDFDTLEEYNEHKMSDKHDTRRRTCPVCQKSLSAKYYKKHVQFQHTYDTPTHVCDICGKTFIVPGQMNRHRLTHFYALPFKCSLCPYRGRFSESLKLHMRQHTGEKPYQCSECAARFVTKSNLTKHMRTHSGPCHKCHMCERAFYTKKTLDTHLRVDHTGVKEHVCNICGKAFGYRKQMMKHQLKVHKRQKLRSGKLPLYLQVKEMRKEEEPET